MQEGELLTMGGGGWQRLFITNNKYLCSKISDNRGLPQNLLWGQAQKCPPHAEKETPPPHRKNGPSMRGSLNLSAYVDCFSGSQGIDG